MARPRLDMVAHPQVTAARHPPATASSSSSNDLLLADRRCSKPSEADRSFLPHWSAAADTLCPTPCAHHLMARLQGALPLSVVASATPTSRFLDEKVVQNSICWLNQLAGSLELEPALLTEYRFPCQ